MKLLAAVLRRIIGAPDYAAYLAHVRCHHPERVPLTEREFLAERLSARYDRPGARCC
ncbi:MAG: YbdD/YjiX family protein [Gemmatimonadaceae bacterium]